MSEVFAISTFSWKSVLFLLVMALLPGAIAYVALRSYGDNSALTWALICSAIVLPLFSLVFIQMALVTSAVDKASVDIGGGIYKVKIPIASIDLPRMGTAKEVDAPRLKWRSNGIGLPGLALGWFHSDRGKVFAVVSARDKVVYLPTDLGYDVLVSPDNPQDFVASIRRLSLKDQAE